ncbi:MAG: YihY/virulence factor BrkB family protein [Chitinophagaceae bacterium]|nr:YihY/virulence factor BrkB family protein [Chitinophagaceae bacterium]
MPTKKKGSRTGIRLFAKLLLQALREMKRNDPLRMAGATAFFTTFALPPILIILFQLFSLFLSQKMVGAELSQFLSDTLGRDAATQLRQITRGFRTIVQHWYTAALGFVFLLFVATTLFTVVRNTLNDIWNIKIKEKAGLLFGLGMRARSIVIIVAAGILFFAGIFIDSFEAIAGNNLDMIWPGGGKFFKGVLDEVISAVIVTTWFILLFRYLADGRPTWKASIAGGVLTGILFSIGQTVLSYLIIHSNIGSIYGKSASFVLILLFVFYSSFILYFGASFIQAYSDAKGTPVFPLRKAVRYRLQEVK